MQISNIEKTKDTDEELYKKGTRTTVEVVSVKSLSKHRVRICTTQTGAEHYDRIIDYEPACGVGSTLDCYVDYADGDGEFFLVVPKRESKPHKTTLNNLLKNLFLCLSLLLCCFLSACTTKPTEEASAVCRLDDCDLDALEEGDKVSLIAYFSVCCLDNKQGYLVDRPLETLPYTNSTLACRGTFAYTGVPVVVTGTLHCAENEADIFGYTYSLYLDIESVEEYTSGEWKYINALITDLKIEDIDYCLSYLDCDIHYDELGFPPSVIDTGLLTGCISYIENLISTEDAACLTDLYDITNDLLSLIEQCNEYLEASAPERVSELSNQFDMLKTSYIKCLRTMP